MPGAPAFALPDTHPPAEAASCGCHSGNVPVAQGAKYCAGSLERRRASSRKSERKRRLLLYNLGLCRDCQTAIPKAGPPPLRRLPGE